MFGARVGQFKNFNLPLCLYSLFFVPRVKIIGIRQYKSVFYWWKTGERNKGWRQSHILLIKELQCWKLLCRYNIISSQNSKKSRLHYQKKKIIQKFMDNHEEISDQEYKTKNSIKDNTQGDSEIQNLLWTITIFTRNISSNPINTQWNYSIGNILINTWSTTDLEIKTKC